MARSPAEVIPQRWLMAYSWTRFLVNLTNKDWLGDSSRSQFLDGLWVLPLPLEIFTCLSALFTCLSAPPRPDGTRQQDQWKGSTTIPHSAFKCHSSHRFPDAEQLPVQLTSWPKMSHTDPTGFPNNWPPSKSEIQEVGQTSKEVRWDGAATCFHAFSMILQTCPQANKMAPFTTYLGLSLPPLPSWESPGLATMQHCWPLAKHLHSGPTVAAAFCQNP